MDDTIVKMNFKIKEHVTNQALAGITRYTLYGLILVFFSLSVALFFPGLFFVDSSAQYQEFLRKEYTDWHPPIMDIWWQIFSNIGSVFIAHILIYYVGLTILIFSFLKENKLICAIITTLFFLNPQFSFYMLSITKDNGMLSFMLICAAFLYLQLKNIISLKTMWILILPFLIYSAGIRHNSMFAIIPLIYYMVLITFKHKGLLIKLLLTALLTISLFALNHFITYQLYQARKVNLETVIMRCDMIAIECFTNHQYKIPNSLFINPKDETLNRNKICSLLDPSNCDPLYWSESAPFQFPLINMQQYTVIKKQWIDSILMHPITYLHFRILVLKQAIFKPRWFLGEAKCRWNCKDNGINYPNILPTLEHIFNSVSNLIGIWIGVLSIFMGFLMFILIHRSKNKASLARYLLYSAFFYGFMCIFLVPAVDARYFLWCYTGVFLSMIFYCAEY